MATDFATRLTRALGDDPVLAALRESLDAFAALRGRDDAAARLDGDLLRGLARVLASQPEIASFLGHRPQLLERLVDVGPDALAAREATLPQDAEEILALDLEDALDALRLRRREETAFAACFDLGGLLRFEAISDFLSVLAETTTQTALALAERTTAPQPLAVIGMGKIAGREFTYHSDLDLVFLYLGGAEQVVGASRVAQRLIAYLTTMTGAGVAYAVDTRLRPSGGQGMLVTSFKGFEDYQAHRAETWEHLALLRARPIAGEIAASNAVLDRVRRQIFARNSSPWPTLADLRQRVEIERAAESPDLVPLKTGAGGLMDVDFVAGGGLLERGTDAFPELPSVRAMCEAWGAGARAEPLLADYRLLRLVEARSRWVAGRPVEGLHTDDPQLDLVATLIEPGLDGPGLLERVAGARLRNRAAFDAVLGAGGVAALLGAV